MSKEHDVSAIACQFQIDGEFAGATTYGSGHINDSYCVTFHKAGVPVRYILQRINHSIFKNPIALMENIQRVTSYLAAKVSGEPDRSRLVLTLIPTRDERAWHVDADGSYWRTYRFIENAHTYDAVESTDQAFQAAKAFGRFQKLLVDLPEPRLHNTIKDFHHTPKRFMTLEQAIASDAAGRAIFAKPEIEFAIAHQSITSVLLDANLPERITHNDTKFNNVMLDDVTGEGICGADGDKPREGRRAGSLQGDHAVLHVRGARARLSRFGWRFLNESREATPCLLRQIDDVRAGHPIPDGLFAGRCLLQSEPRRTQP